jgi:hypothetical protein
MARPMGSPMKASAVMRMSADAKGSDTAQTPEVILVTSGASDDLFPQMAW